MVKCSHIIKSLGLKHQCQDVSSMEWSPLSGKRQQSTERTAALDSCRKIKIANSLLCSEKL